MPGDDHQLRHAQLYVLWDEAYLWVLMLRHALRHGRFPFRLVRAREISAGLLQQQPPKALLVPGGWARFKSAALGRKGREAVTKYLAAGGAYLGFCGGAGLALPEQDGLDICPLCRKPMAQRLPNFSGNVAAALHAHPLVPQTHPSEIYLPVWWPSQFAASSETNVQVLASYAGPGPDFWVSDLAWADIRDSAALVWQQRYGINLNPDLLAGEPAVISGSYGQNGRGRYILSYAHLESPNAPAANIWLGHMLSLLLGQVPSLASPEAGTVPEWDLRNAPILWENPRLERMDAGLNLLIALGMRHFLLCWRRPWLLGWRRGLPGFALTTLFAQIKTAGSLAPTREALCFWEEHGPGTERMLGEFVELMSVYLLNERLARHNSQPSSPGACSDPAQHALRETLVGRFPGYGGLFGRIAKAMDEVLWLLCKRERSSLPEKSLVQKDILHQAC